MATRNWWIEVVIDGRKTRLRGGPRSKDGGFTLTIQQRAEGCRELVGSLKGEVTPCGKSLRLSGTVAGKNVKRFTQR